ncbi:ATP-binding protein [Rhodococcus sp. IEGM 1330]|uniref:ATP-binding protein n=1 Tax=Rhodococcus sp. IEGM 1330 TaxID=3082225 RepID=UPI002955D684|nr:ATP-binding protein [Rhodococcus sp. IEGM 1330]MDV8024807.1 ATP-binding protein [Rhodococcus sp. IEGM 1330]
MNIPDIDFSYIRSTGPAGQRGGFEQFICQQVAQESPAIDAKFVSLHGHGGDGGVECYWTLPNGDEHGWQAKYWTNHKEVDKAQLDKSVKSALNQHPKLAKYSIAIPTDPTGPTGGRGKSLLEKITRAGGWLEGWQKMATTLGRTVTFEIDWETHIVDRLNRLDTSGTQRRYWFDVDVLNEQWWQDRERDAVSAARPRYMPELNIDVPAARSIAALCSDDEWWQLVLDQAEQITKAAESLDYADNDVMAADLNVARRAAQVATAAITAWQSSRTATGPSDVEQLLKDATAAVAEQEAIEAEALTDLHGDWDSPGWRQWQSEYMVQFPASAVDSLRELGQKLDAVTRLVGSSEGKLAGTQVALMTGPAGIGKTYLAIDAVVRRLTKGRPSVMMHGRWFNSQEPLAHLREVLHMPRDLTGEETIALLDECARSAGAPTLLVIDALNDTRPRSLWRDNLDRIVTILGRYPNVRLLLTARTHYVAQVLPSGMHLERFEHTGFEGVEFEAVSEYAGFYGLEPPTSPPIHGEFDNPLYLRLVCEALQANSRLSLDQADMGLDELTKMILGNANNVVSDRIDASPSDLVVNRAMHVLATAIADAGGYPLTRPAAQAMLTSIWSDISAEKSLLDALIAQGLVEEDVIPDGSPYGTDIVAITFERIGHHLIVSDALRTVTDIGGVKAQFTGRLGKLIGLRGTIDLGILEATSVVLAARLGIELTELQDEISDDDALAAAVVAGIGWRSSTGMTGKTIDIVLDALEREPTFKAALTMLFRLAARPKHPMNADFLHDFLSRLNMGERDSFLATWLHVTHATNGAVDRLIRWAQEKPLDEVGAETTRLWTTALLWTTSATDRRVREPATVAAARLLARHPSQAAKLLRQFATVNDEWVIERALVVAYAALLANGLTAEWEAAAEIVQNRFFARPADLTPNAAVRDAARSILEAAADRGALPAGVTVDKFRPPYTSHWPLDWPTEADIEPYNNADHPKLVRSTTDDDFRHYYIEYELSGRPGVDVPAGARWVVTEVIRLGYRPELHRLFDGYVVAKYGGGRGKPKWIERIGKKYQWIALNRLIGHLSDHASKTPGKWDPPPPSVPGPATTISRQIDPTVVEFTPANDNPRPWVPAYDFSTAAGKTDSQWVADDSDIPSIDITNAGFGERPFIVLSGTYEWKDVGDHGRRSRGMWAHLYPHIVATTDLSAAVAELEGNDLTGGHDISMPRSITYGFVGEFPYGHHYGANIHTIMNEPIRPPNVTVQPASWHILGEYEYATGDHETISIDAPAPEFFGPAPGNLRWNGRDGWTDTATGQLVAVLRHTVNAARNELLIERAWLDTWLTTHQKSLIWIENTGRDVLRDSRTRKSTHPGELTRSLVHSWTPGSAIQSASPGWNRIPARGE